MIETYVETTEQRIYSNPDVRNKFIALASFAGIVIDHAWFSDYNSAATWCLDYTLRYKVTK
jgi:hypothetical protein